MILLSIQLLVWALAKGEDVSYGAGWTDIPDAPPSTSLQISPKAT